jgi:hypothetical protein
LGERCGWRLTNLPGYSLKKVKYFVSGVYCGVAACLLRQSFPLGTAGLDRQEHQASAGLALSPRTKPAERRLRMEKGRRPRHDTQTKELYAGVRFQSPFATKAAFRHLPVKEVETGYGDNANRHKDQIYISHLKYPAVETCA